MEDEQLPIEELPLQHMNPQRTRFIVLEGIDLSGRTTQVQLLREWLVAQNYRVTTTAWRTSPLISDVLVRARAGSPLHSLTYSMLYCADHLDRTLSVIKPALAKGEIVLADRYIYTAFARDEARGLERAWIRNLYRFAIQPDVAFYLHISPDEAVTRRQALQQQAQEHAEKHKSSRKDEGKHQKQDKAQPSVPVTNLESFRTFEKQMYTQYESMQEEFGFTVIEGSQSIDLVQATLRDAVMHLLLDV